MQFVIIQPPQNPPGPPQTPTPRGEQPVPLLGSAFLILAGVILAVYYLVKLKRYGGRK